VSRWKSLGIHWHAYSERSETPTRARSTRQERLATPPQAVFATPEQAADWIAVMTGRHSHRQPVWLIGSDGDWAAVGDDGHVLHERHSALVGLRRGDSHYSDCRGAEGRLHLWVEAVTPAECAQEHHASWTSELP
jgi:hypothetical protein